jgi:hypothetical protein
MLIRLLYSLILFGMGMNGVLYLAWFLSPPDPDRIGFWYLIYFIVLPFLGLLGIAALLLKQTLNFSWWVGAWLVLYVSILTFLINSDRLGFDWVLAGLPEGVFEVLHVVAFTVTLIGLLVVMQRR